MGKKAEKSKIASEAKNVLKKDKMGKKDEKWAKS